MYWRTLCRWKYTVVVVVFGLVYLRRGTGGAELGSIPSNSVSTVVRGASRESYDRLVRHVEGWVSLQNEAVREDFVGYMKGKAVRPVVAWLERVLDWVLWGYKIAVPLMVLGKLSGGAGRDGDRHGYDEVNKGEECDGREDLEGRVVGEGGGCPRTDVRTPLASTGEGMARRRRRVSSGSSVREKEMEKEIKLEIKLEEDNERGNHRNDDQAVEFQTIKPRLHHLKISHVESPVAVGTPSFNTEM